MAWKARCVAVIKDDECGDKVQLPASELPALNSLISGGSPLLLRLKPNPISRTSVSAGVLDFTAPAGCIGLPRWMAEALGLGEGETASVCVELAPLPKADFASLRPVDPAFFALRDHRAVLELGLSQQFATLTKGTTVSVAHFSNVYQLKVEDLQPEDACCILDTEMEVEVPPPLDADGNMLALPAVQDAPSRDELLEVAVGHSPGLQTTVTDAQYATCKFTLPAKGTPFLAQVEALGAEADVEAYVGGFNTQRPTREQHLFANNLGDNWRRACVYMSAEEAKEAVYYLGVRAYGCPKAAVAVTILAGEFAEAEFQRLGMRGRGQDGDAALAAPAPGMIRCGNCREEVPEARFVLHSAYCERNNTFCRICCKAVRKADLKRHWHCDQCVDHPFVTNTPAAREKHLQLFHTPSTCVCGVNLDMFPMARHKAQECPKRMITCRFCFNYVEAGPLPADFGDRYKGLSQHESICGSRTAQCPTCKVNIRLKDMEVHQRLHDMPGQEPAPAAGPAASSSGVSELQRLQAWFRAFPESMSEGDRQRLQQLEAAQQPQPQPARAAVPEGFYQPVTPPPRPKPVPLCSTVGCINPRAANIADLCPDCFQRVCPPGSRRDMSAVLSALTKAYFTQGCGNAGCGNIGFCTTAGRPAQAPAAAATECLKLAGIAVGKGAKTGHLCVTPEMHGRAQQLGSLTDMGFDREWAALALGTTGYDTPAAAQWLLNNVP